MIGTALYKKYKEEARVLVHARLEHFNQYYNLPYKKVFIKNPKTRWGSCSSAGNLNFSYKILFLDPALQDYLIVHELCHLKQFNHSKAFWDLVSEQIPDYKKLHVVLKRKNNLKLLLDAWRKAM
ncbi:MAG TPA: M48 family metallopeptidase [Candidatus Paceibacterota bacterium]|jgi:predicted metal-dependent hydrolase|nr:M48 family metallopeptidase [Candidatus Paceibacterota bacterium]